MSTAQRVVLPLGFSWKPFWDVSFQLRWPQPVQCRQVIPLDTFQTSFC